MKTVKALSVGILLVRLLLGSYSLTHALIFNLRRNPYVRSQLTSNTYYDWLLDRAYLLVSAQAYVGKFLATFKDYPSRMKAASFSLDKVMENLSSHGGHNKPGLFYYDAGRADLSSPYKIF